MTAKTLSVILKEKFNKMSDDINNVKEINIFYKEALKDAVEENKVVGKKKKPSQEKNENGEEKVKKPPTEYQEFVKNYQKIIKEKYPELKSNERFGKIAEEWKKHKENRDNKEPVVNNFMKVEEVSPPTSDNEDEPKESPKLKTKEKVVEQTKLPSEEPDEEAVEEQPMTSFKKKKSSLRNLPPIKIPANRM
jgi:hypothetical protein